MNLVIVESPTKAKTITKFLGHNYTVKSSYGHVRDLPEKKLGIDVNHDFQPEYVITTKAKKNLAELKKLSQQADSLILATDEDREGEAIAWHLLYALGMDKPKYANRVLRIVFHEITKGAIEEALKNPRPLDLNLVDAQQTRRILDRLVGYKLSPLLWKKVAKGLSAGRVQSVAVRLIADREREIENFKTEEYWTITALLSQLENKGATFEANLYKINGQSLNKLAIKNTKEAQAIIINAQKANYQIAEINKREISKNPSAPFTTSTLQQEAALRFGYSSKQTMLIAQQLYEGVELGEEGSVGLITYMRTDSQNLAEDAVRQIREKIENSFGQKYLPSEPNKYKTKSKGAQEAHEAIRPTDANREPETIKNYLDSRQYKLYNLIWRRTMACQMTPAIMDSTTVDVLADAQTDQYGFKANGSTIKFDGFLKVYPRKTNEVILPSLNKGETLDLLQITPNQHFTQPPARYNEAMLIKTLEEHGIGRPSTYAPTISTIQDRKYVEKNEDRRFKPTEIGLLVNDLLVKNFPQIVDLQFTAKMEEELDDIAEGKEKMVPIIKEFYEPFIKNLKEKEKEIAKVIQQTDKLCPNCGKNLVIKFSRYGKFYACPGFPECKYIESIKEPPKSTGVKCPSCQKGEIIEKRSKKGKIFYACNQYPDCTYALWDKPLDQICPKCGSLLVETKAKKIKCPVCDKGSKTKTS